MGRTRVHGSSDLFSDLRIEGLSATRQMPDRPDGSDSEKIILLDLQLLVSMRTFLIFSLFLLLIPSFTFATSDEIESDQNQTPWSFVIIGDTQDAVMDTKTGISPMLPALFKAIASEKPDFVLHTGDCISGEYTADDSPAMGNFIGMYRHFMEAAAPVYNYSSHSGIPIYTVRGNHDNGNRYEGNESLIDAYLSTIARDLPTNGPEGEEQFSYTFIHNGALFIGVDEYIPHNGKIATVNQEWLDSALAGAGTPFIFVWGHSPAYPLNKNGIDPYVMSLFPEDRDAFWNSMVSHHVPLYFCGHYHLYSRGQKEGTWQIIGGTGGGSASGYDPGAVDPSLQVAYPTEPVPAMDQGIGYSLVTVDIANGTVSLVHKQYQGNRETWQVIDSSVIPVG